MCLVEKKMMKSVIILFWAGVLVCVDVHASILVRASYDGFNNGYGKPGWTRFTALIDVASGTNVVTTASLENAQQVSSAHSLWIDVGGTSGVLSATEKSNIRDFIASGKRVVMIGDHITWSGWNYQITSFVAGRTSGSRFTNGEAFVIRDHKLTRDVASIDIGTGAILWGGDTFFSQDVATLFGPSENVLVILDSNIFDDTFIGRADNTMFSKNVATWISKTGNGTPLLWMDLYGLLIDTADPDLDGHFSWEEYVCGTDPTNELSHFSVNLTDSSLRWDPVSNRTYSIEFSLSLTNGFSQVTNGLTSSPFTLENWLRMSCLFA